MPRNRGRNPWLPVPVAVGLVTIVILVCAVFLIDGRGLLPSAHAGEPFTSPSTAERDSDVVDLSTLNVRLSTRAIRPPQDQVKRTVVLHGMRAVKPLAGELTRAAILEDDTRRRVMVISTDGKSPDGPIHAYLLYEFDVERYLSGLSACTRKRRCSQDRTPGTGGLGCVAICLVELLRQ